MVTELSERYGLEVDPSTLVEDLPVGVQQRVEIIKALSNEAKVLILDEPTAVLTPQEIDELMDIMRSLKEQGTSIIFITHKLREVKAVGDRITVIRRGKVVGTAPPSTSEAELAEMMVGREVKLKVDKDPPKTGAVVMSVEGCTVVDPRGHQVVKDVSFEARAGEVLGIAGVQGNGQTELIKALLGLVKPDAGVIRLDGDDISKHGPRESLDDGIGYVPEDRSHDGYVGAFTVRENLVLDLYRSDEFSRGLVLKLDDIAANADAPDRGVRHPHRVGLDTGLVAVGRQPAEGRGGPGVLAAAQGADRLPADPRRGRRLDRVHPQADHLRARQGHRGDHRLHRARRDLRARRPDRGHVRRPDRRTRSAPTSPARTSAC